MATMSPVPTNNRDNPQREDEDRDNIDAMDTPQFIVPHSGSDTDDDEGFDYQGYQPLPVEPESALGDQDQDNSVGVMMDIAPEPSSQGPEGAESDQDDVHQRPTVGNTERQELWNAPRENKPAEQMDSDQAEKIRQAMSGFVLPESSHPEWARKMSEDDWKAQLVTRIHCSTQQVPQFRQQDSKSSSTSNTQAEGLR